MTDVPAPTGRRVCMFVYNNCASDPRVLKEASSLTSAGYEVTVVAVLDKHTVPSEERDGTRIVRINRDPLHYKARRASHQIRRHGRMSRGRFRRQRRRLVKRARTGARAVRGRAKRLRRTFTHPSQPRLLRLGALLLGGLTSGAGFVALHGWRVARRRVAGSYRRAPSDGAPSWLRAGATTLDRDLSSVTYRTMMKFHKPLLYFDWYYRSAKLVKEERFDTFHAHDLNTLPVATFLARRSGARLVYDAHELYPEVSTLSRREAGIWRRVESLLIKRPDHIITVGQSIAEEFVRRYGVPQPRVLLNCPAATPIANRPTGHPLRERAGLLADSRPIVLYQGGFAPHRGLEQLVDAARELRHASLVLMGWGLLEEQLRDRIASAGLEGTVRLIPPARREELLALTADADVGVIPYRPVGLNNTFTTPNKLFEYIRAGVAIAASRLPELVRFVEEPRLGATFNPDDPADIARVLNHLTEDPDRLAAIRRRTVAARDQFVWEREAEVLLAVYES